MKRLFGPAIITLLLAIALAIGGSALAYFSSEGAGSAQAAVSKLTTPTISAATPAAGGTVALTWAAVTAPGAAESVRYYVTRDGGQPAGSCPSAAAPTTVTTCTDSGVAIGDHTYTVTAVWETWTAASGAKTAKVTVGPATQFTIAASTTTPAVNGSVNLTITARDASNSTVTTYTGSKSLVFSGASASPSGTKPTVANSSGSAIAFGSATALTFTAGVAAVSSSKNGLMKLYRSGEALVSASEGSITTPTPLQFTVSPGTATKFVLAAATTTPTAGAGDDLTITAQDTYGNTATSYAGAKNVTFSGASASPSGALPTVVNSAGTAVNFGSVTALNFTNGVASVGSGKNGLMRLPNAGATSVSAGDGTIAVASPLAVTVSVGAASRLGLSGVTASAGTIGSPCLFTCPITALGNGGTVTAGVSVTDASGNTLSGLGEGHGVKVTANGGTVTGGTLLTIASAGPAVSTTQFTYAAPASGSFTNTITAVKSGGTTYTSATATASK